MPSLLDRNKRGLGIIESDRIACYPTALDVLGHCPNEHSELIIGDCGVPVQPVESMEDFSDSLWGYHELGIQNSEHLIK